jgi:hypothetical protein
MKTSIYDELSDMADDSHDAMYDVHHGTQKMKKSARARLAGYDAASVADGNPWPWLRRMGRKG